MIPLMLRLNGESDESLRFRVKRAGKIAKILVQACLQNCCMQGYIEDPTLPFITKESIKRNPTIHIEYEQTIAFGGIGETLEVVKKFASLEAVLSVKGLH